MSKLPKLVTSYLLKGCEEFQIDEDIVTPAEEQCMVARLVCGIYVKFLGVSEYTDFEDDEKLRSKIITATLQIFVIFAVVALGVAYGTLCFIIVGFRYDELKPWVLIGASNLFECFAPFIVLPTYWLQSENMIKLTRKYIASCRGINENQRNFYRDLTIKVKLFHIIFRFNIVIGFAYLYLHNAYCFENDQRFVCGLFTPLWFPFETNFFPVRELLVLFSTLFVGYFCIFILHVITDTFVFAELYEYKAKNLMKMMQNTSLSRHQNIEIVKINLYNIVRNHQELQECFLLMKKILGDVSIPILVGFVPVIAAHTTCLIKDPNIAFLDGILVFYTLYYLWCEKMQNITDVGEELQDAAYGMNWYEMDNRIKKDFLLFLMKLQQPMEIECLIFILRKPICVSMMRSMYSFLMMILNVN